MLAPVSDGENMTTTADIAALFADARNMYAAAQERLDQGDLRDAGEKAWRAVNRACTGGWLPPDGGNVKNLSQGKQRAGKSGLPGPGFQSPL